MSLKQNTFNKYANPFYALRGIKRKEYMFKEFIKEVHPIYITLDEVAVIKALNTVIEVLFKHHVQHVIILNEKEEYKKAMAKFATDNHFTLINQKYKIGSFTNMNNKPFYDASLVLSFHDRRDRNAILEAKNLGLTTVGITNLSRGCRLFNHYVLINNFSLKTIILVTWYITTGLKQLRGETNPSFEEYFTEIYGSDDAIR